MAEHSAEKDVPPHECDTGHFDRTICPEPCGYMHSYCATCGVRQDPCAHDTRPIPPGDGFDARKVADKVRERLEAVGEWTDDDGVQLRMRDGRVERVIPPGTGGTDA